MIRLRSAIERSLGRRWLGPLIVLVLVVMLVFVVLHTTVDAAHDETGLACLTLAAVVILLLARQRGEVEPPLAKSDLRRRGPPPRCQTVSRIVPLAIPPPLRL